MTDLAHDVPGLGSTNRRAVHDSGIDTSYSSDMESVSSDNYQFRARGGRRSGHDSAGFLSI
jgi:hypothetical protein